MILFEDPVQTGSLGAMFGKPARGAVPVLITTLDAATANIMFVPYSSQNNLLRHARSPGSPRPDHGYASAFRPEYTGGAGTLGLPGYTLSDTNILPYSQTLQQVWDGSVAFTPGADPRSDLAGHDAIVLVLGDGGWRAADGGYLWQPRRWDSNEHEAGLAANVSVALQFVQAAVTAGVGTILIYGQCPDLPGTPLATDDAPWR
ncbi:hypothetical protein, partial [uncultured Paracoccus sp.]|uniref:hypothetical protein n=1 Tax=uncultured Paracoccus sp. TaxID=189685 RepID=UPI00262837A8